MINLPHGITYLEGIKYRVYLVTAYSISKNRIAQLFVIGTSERSASNAAQRLIDTKKNDFKVISSKNIYSMLKLLEKDHASNEPRYL
jgi:hypothetical protein